MIPEQPQRRAIVASIVIDDLVFSLALLLGYAVSWLVERPLTPLLEVFQPYLDVFWMPLLVVPASFYFNGIYRRDPYRLLLRSGERIFAGCMTALCGMLVLSYLMRGYLVPGGTGIHAAPDQVRWGLPLHVLFFAIVLAPALILGWRFLANKIECWTVGWSRQPLNLLVAGALSPSDVKRLSRMHSPHYKLVGYLEGNSTAKVDPGIPRLGTLGDADGVMVAQKVDEMLIICDQVSRDEMLDCLSLASSKGIRPWFVAGIYDTIASAARIAQRGSVPCLEMREAAIAGWGFVFKRVMDIFVSALLLAVTGPLLILPACILIVIDSKGFPVFCQERVGMGGRRFRLYKLRTMVIDADKRGPKLTEDNDPRITRFGHFLRRTSIDELPQLLNVLKGDMSLIGPRAVVPFVSDQFAEWERISLNVRPGLTGLAQVSGRDEVGFREKSLLNVYYVRNHSFWLDMRIFIATIIVVLTMEGTGGTRRD